MKTFFIKLPLNKKLALIIFILSFIAIFAGSPYKGQETVISTKELSLIVEGKIDHVFSEELADWIIKGKSDFRLVDLRTEKEFNEYHIPGAENIPLTEIENSNLKRNEKLVIYSEGGIHSAQAWFLLRARNFKSAYMLFGGLEEWKDKILFPKIVDTTSAEQIIAFKKTKEICKFFGGQPQSGVEFESSSIKLSLPKLESQTQSISVPSTGKKKKEGC